jgi:nucleoside-diphosphate-sugar epimerase
MEVLITGGNGRVGTAIIDHLGDIEEYSFTNLDIEPHPDPDVRTITADLREYEAILPYFRDADAIVHLARIPLDDASDRTIQWSEGHSENLRIHTNTIAAAIEADIDSFVYASSNHVVGMYEVLNAPEIYYPGFDLTIDHTVLPRPDSIYGNQKVYTEGLGRLAADTRGLQFYSLRIGAVRHPEYDHPYGDAECGVDTGEFERGSEEYREQVARMKCLWQSRRDFGHMVDCCLRDESVAFDIFYGVSENDRGWFDIEHAREKIEYTPRDNGDEWDGPPR